MVSNNTGIRAGYLAGRFPGLIGHLYSPGGGAGPFEFVPYALDNGRFSCWSSGKEWDEDAYKAMLMKYSHCQQQPAWALVPDVVADKTGTLEQWSIWAGMIRRVYGYKLAFAVQDGVVAQDVPDDVDFLFVGGSTEWKLRTLCYWCDNFPGRVHVGRVNSYQRLCVCAEAGAISVDGTGWFRSGPRQYSALLRWLKEESGERKRLTLFCDPMKAGE